MKAGEVKGIVSSSKMHKITHTHARMYPHAYTACHTSRVIRPAALTNMRKKPLSQPSISKESRGENPKLFPQNFPVKKQEPNGFPETHFSCD